MTKSEPDQPHQSRSESVTATSQSLLAQLKSDVPEGWERMVRLYSPQIVQWCRMLGLPEQDLPDVYQEVFRAVATSIQSFQSNPERGTFRGWLRTVTRSKVMDYYRRRGRIIPPIGGTDAQHRLEQIPFDHDQHETSEPSDPEQKISLDLYHRAVREIRGHFNERTWQAFWQVVVEGKSAAEVGQHLGMRPGTVRVAKSRVLHRLRQELGDWPE